MFFLLRTNGNWWVLLLWKRLWNSNLLELIQNVRCGWRGPWNCNLLTTCMVLSGTTNWITAAADTHDGTRVKLIMDVPGINPWWSWRSREGREEAGLGVWRAAWYSLGTGKLSYMGLVYDMREAFSINPAYVCSNLSYLNLTYGMGKLYKVSPCVWSGQFDYKNLACGLSMLTVNLALFYSSGFSASPLPFAMDLHLDLGPLNLMLRGCG